MPTFGWQDNESPHAQFIRSVDWSATAIGAPETWPQQLHQMIDLILLDPTPSAIMWGDSLTMVYNDGFVEFAGEKHPKLMGGTPMVSYAEVWEAQFAPIIKLGREEGKATRHKGVPLFLKRHGYLEYVIPTLVSRQHVDLFQRGLCGLHFYTAHWKQQGSRRILSYCCRNYRSEPGQTKDSNIDRYR